MRAQENNDLDAAVRGYQSVLEAGARADVANLLAIALDQAGATEAAERVLATALAEDRSDPAAFLNLGRLLARRGAAKEALAPLRVAVEAGSQEAGPLYLATATAALDHGQIIHAAETMLRDGSFQPEYWRQLVGACFQRGQKARAGGYAQAAVLSAPASVSIFLLNAETAGALGRLSENTKQTGRAAMVAPGDPGVQSSLALARAAGGDREGGIRAYRRSLCLDPGIAERWNDYGALMKPTGELVSAGRCFDRAAMADPGLAMALRNRAGLFADVKESAKSRALYERALALAPENTALAFLRVLTFPTIAPDEAAIAGIRAEIMAVIKQLSTSGARIADPLVDVGLPNFYLAYHGLNDREIQSTIADAYLALCPGLAFAAPHCKAPRPLGGPGERKLRVGFVSRFFHDHSIRYSTAGIMRNLDRSLFEVHVISDRSAGQVTLFRPGEKADSHTVIHIDLGRARSVIAGLELDVLIYGDIGMEPLTY
ncbi:MAG: hypothetical protein P8N43_09655 [Alphaproteobacteria bacterium]|nr:hypothetical protein [Alphaproteobacteria bacterium]